MRAGIDTAELQDTTGGKGDAMHVDEGKTSSGDSVRHRLMRKYSRRVHTYMHWQAVVAGGLRDVHLAECAFFDSVPVIARSHDCLFKR